MVKSMAVTAKRVEERTELPPEEHGELLPSPGRQQAGTLALRVWTFEDGVVYERKPAPPYTITVPKMRTCGDKAREIISKAEPLAVSDTGYRIMVLWVPDDPFEGRVYYVVPIKARVRGRKRVCVRVFENLDDAILYTLYPPRGSEPA
jgi:hypothetical protein